MLSYLRKSRFVAIAALLLFAFTPVVTIPAAAEERYPEVARLSFVSGGVTFSRGDDPDEWDDALENVPLAVGDRIYSPRDGRAEIQFSSGNFVRLAPQSYFSTLNLSEDTKQFYLGEGAASFRIRRLAPDEVFEVSTPNISVTFEEPGEYRLVVDDSGDSRIVVRRGRAVLAAGGRQITVANSEARVYGIDAPTYEIIGLSPADDFDRWAAERDNRYDRDFADAHRFASEDITGAEDLAGNGRWEQIPDYGYAWTPTVVAVGWTPFSNGRWYWQDPWGWNWISHERWGWATSHYGRWTPYRSRWYWVPVRPRNRVRYAPACVEFVRVRDHVGWFPLHPRDRHVPWWERRDRRFDRNVTYVNRNYVTVVNHNHFISARPVQRYIVRDAVIVRDARAARFADTLPIPTRSSLRMMSEDGRRRGFKPSDQVLNRAAVVRTAPPAPPRAFQEKLPEIEKNQGRALDPGRVLASADRGRRVRVRPAVETDRGELAPRNANASAGAPLQTVTEARGKKLAGREGGTDTSRDRPQNSQTTQQRSQPALGQSPQGLQEKPPQAQSEERKAPAQKQQVRARQPEAEGKRAIEQKQQEEQSKIQAQKQRPQERQGTPRTPEQQRLEELERQSRLEEERKAQAQSRQQQERQNAIEQQRQRQAQEQRKVEMDRRQDERKAPALQQQEQARREQQIRQQQQALERQAREQQQRQQEADRQQLQQQRDRERMIQSQQRQQQLQERQIRQAQPQPPGEAPPRPSPPQPQQEQRVQPRRPQPAERPMPQQPVPQSLQQPNQRNG